MAEEAKGRGRALERALAVRDQRRSRGAPPVTPDAEAAEAAREAERRAIDEIDRRLTERARSREALPTEEVPRPRRKPRFDVQASLIIELGGAVVMCPIVDLSVTGALFSTQGAPSESLSLGSAHSVTIVADADAKLQVELVGFIARCVGDTFALDWSRSEPAKQGVARLLDRLSRPREPSEDERRRAEIDEIDERLELLEEEPRGARTRPPPERAKPRLVLSAILLLDHDGRSEELVLHNVSRTGALVHSAGATISRLRVGTLLLMTLRRSDAPEGVDLVARIVRHEGYATGIDWAEDKAAEYDIARFLDALAAEREDS